MTEWPGTGDATDAEGFALLRRLFGAKDHLWSIGTLAGFMGFDLTGSPRCDEGGLVLGPLAGGEAAEAPVPEDVRLGGAEAAQHLSDASESGGPEWPGTGRVSAEQRAAGYARARLRPGARVLAFETLSSAPRGWNHGIALCLPSGPALPHLPGQMIWHESDPDAILPGDRSRAVLELLPGLYGLHCLFRPDPDCISVARGLAGRTWPDSRPDLLLLQGDWIIATPCLRAERRMAKGVGECPLHAVPVAGGRGLTHAATTPVPSGWTPFAHIFPPHPARSGPGVARNFDPDAHAAFQQILACHGRPDLWALKEAIRAQLRGGRFDPPRADRHAMAVIRVTLRQWLCETGQAPPGDWLRRYDRPLLNALEGAQ